MNYEGYSRCACAAITITVDGQSYSCLGYRRKKFFPDLDLRKIPRFEITHSCNHCVNHYGLDLCGCGSGNLFGHCDNGFEECKKPMQAIGKYGCIRADNAWC